MYVNELWLKISKPKEGHTDIQTQKHKSPNTMSPNRPTPRDTVIKRAKNPHAKQKT